MYQLALEYIAHTDAVVDRDYSVFLDGFVQRDAMLLYSLEQQERIPVQSQRQPLDEPEGVSPLKKVVLALAGALNARASGMNPNVQQQDFLGEILKMQQGDSDRKNLRNERDFQTELQQAVFDLHHTARERLVDFQF